MTTSSAEAQAAHVAGVGSIPAWTIGDRLRKAREVTGLKQAVFAKQIDVSQNTVGNYESGKVEPRRIVLKQWALRAGVPLEWILTGAETKEAPLPEGNGASSGGLHPELNWRPSHYE